MKRQIANPSKFFVILAAFMLLAVQGVTYGQMVSIDPATVESPAAGEQLTLNINITGGANVAGYQVSVTFDPTALSNATIANGDYLPAGAFVAPVPATDTSVGLGATAIGATADGDGILATVTFTVVEAKDSAIGLEVLISDPTATAIDVTVEGGTVTGPAPEMPAEPETPETPAEPEMPETVEFPEPPVTPEPPKEPAIPTEPTNMFEMTLAPGLNMISLPLMPAEPYTASSFAEAVGATVVIQLNTAIQQFEGFTADQEGDGFPIEGGKGYIINVPDGGTVTFTGTAWNNTMEAAAAAPGIELPGTTWAFVVSGDLLETEAGVSYTVVAKNHRTGEVATRQVSSEHREFNTVWADLSRTSVIEAGDTLEVILFDDLGNIVSGPFTHMVDVEDLRKAYLSLPLTVGDVHPSETILAQNFPNPFNPETWIPYQLEKSADVTLQIYDTSGGIVRTIDLGFKSQGFYMTRSTAAYWDGRNNMGEQVASGVYFYSLQTADFSATRKMLILK